MPADSLVQHRRELDATFETLKAMREHAHAAAALDGAVTAALAELRAEIRAVANRVESLTRSVGANGGEHSIRAVSPAAGFALVVIDVESDPAEIVGSYLRTVEDVVEYVNPDNLVRSAPADSVRVVEHREAAKVLREELTT